MSTCFVLTHSLAFRISHFAFRILASVCLGLPCGSLPFSFVQLAKCACPIWDTPPISLSSHLLHLDNCERRLRWLELRFLAHFCFFGFSAVGRGAISNSKRANLHKANSSSSEPTLTTPLWMAGDPPPVWQEMRHFFLHVSGRSEKGFPVKLLPGLTL